MDAYFQEISKWLNVDKNTVEGIMLINKDGVIEYYKNYESVRKTPENFEKEVIGRHLLEVYPELTDETSTVMRTLRTGKVTVGSRQRLFIGGTLIDFASTTYPILDEQGHVQGAVEVVRSVGDIPAGEPCLSVPSQKTILDGIITQSECVRQLKQNLPKIAYTGSPILLCGETGTGKGLIAESIHKLSKRTNKRLLAQSCAAIPDTLLESTFFGTEKGSFTGAESKQGLFELADGGTLFLDEINSMNVSMQAKLLKALEDKTIRRVGGKDDIPFDVRIICATNEEPQQLIDSGRMRSDFYYRIGVVQLHLPPLRKRSEDILPLADHFVQYFNQKMGLSIAGLSSMTKDLFLNWSWPGNIRELRNVIEGAFNIEESPLITLNSVQTLLDRFRSASTAPAPDAVRPEQSGRSEICEALANGPVDLKQLLEQYEAGIIREALAQTDRLSAAANLLSISPQKLQYRIEKLGLK